MSWERQNTDFKIYRIDIEVNNLIIVGNMSGLYYCDMGWGKNTYLFSWRNIHL